MAFRSAFLLLFLFPCLDFQEFENLDNELVGSPEIECGPDGLQMNIDTKHPFNGQVYVKSQYADPACRNVESGIRTAGITLKFNSCRIQRLRSLEPRGVQVSVTLVVTFHPKFVTKNDKAYKIKCFYMESVRELTAAMDVAQMTTALIMNSAPTAKCRYDVLSGGPEGKAVKHVNVGQQVYHRWQCDTPTENLYCIRVHSCIVDDGNGDNVTLLDEDGCARDHQLLENLDYVSDTAAGQLSTVFKYADRPQLYFKCSIDVSVKEPTQICPRPSCGDPRAATFLRMRRSTFDLSDPLNTLDVAVSLNAYSIDETDYLPYSYADDDQMCISSFTFTAVIVSMSVVLFVSAMVGTTMILLKRKF